MVGARSRDQMLTSDWPQLHMDCDLAHMEPWASSSTSHTDLQRYALNLVTRVSHVSPRRLRRGGVGGQFWSAYIGCEEGRRGGALRMFLEQVGASTSRL